MMKEHGSIVFDRKKKPPLMYLPGAGQSFLNGQPLTVGQESPLKHNDRLIFGNAQAFRVVDPLDPEAKKGTKLIDWDLAQTELADALGATVDLKVEEEVAKKKAELDAQFKAMEEKFAKENEKLRSELSKNDPST